MRKFKLLSLLLLILPLSLTGCEQIRSWFGGDDSSSSSKSYSYTYSPTTYSSSNAADIPVELTCDWGFIEVSKVDDFRKIKEMELVRPTSFVVKTDYYLILRITMIPRSNTNGETNVTCNITFPNVNFVSGTIFSAEGGEEEAEKSYTDPNTGALGKRLPINTVLPKGKDVVKKVDIAIKMITNNVGDTKFIYSFTGKGIDFGASTLNDGQLLEVKPAQIESPEISYNEDELQLAWKHVKFATRYILYVDGERFQDGDGNDAVKTVKDTDPIGLMLTWNLNQYIYGVHNVQIVATADSTNFIDGYSNVVTANV